MREHSTTLEYFIRTVGESRWILRKPSSGTEGRDAGGRLAQYNLGFMYFNGQGVPQNYAEAARWYRKAAEQGDVDATRILGLAYYLGKGVPQDLVQSYFWFSLAASRATGDEYRQASEAKDRVAKELTPEKLKEAQRRVREWEKSHPGK